MGRVLNPYTLGFLDTSVNAVYRAEKAKTFQKVGLFFIALRLALNIIEFYRIMEGRSTTFITV